MEKEEVLLKKEILDVKIKNKMENNPRFYFLDILKTIAIIFVLYNHRGFYGYAEYINSANLEFFILSTLAILCKVACPIFFMISGAMLLKKEESFKCIFKHRILRILIIMIFCSLWMSIDDFTIKNIVNNLLKNQNWYIYSYLAFLVMLPFFRAMVKGMNKNMFILYFILVCVFYHIPLILDLPLFINGIGLFSSNGLSSACWHIVFPILGYYFMNIENLNFSKIEIKIQYLLILALVVIEFSIGYFFIYKDIINNAGLNIERVNQTLCLFPACFIFFSFKLLAGKVQKWPKILLKGFYHVSISTFGIFLFDVYTKYNVRFIDFLSKNLISHIGAFATNMLGIFLIIIVQTIIISLLKKIPFIKKII